MRHWNKRGVKKARYWPSSFYWFLWTETQSRFHKISRRKRTKKLFPSKKKIIVSDYCIRSRWKAKKKIIHLFIFSPIFPFVMVGIIIIFLITGVSKSKSGDFINGKVISKFGFNLPQCNEVRLQMSTGLH